MKMAKLNVPCGTAAQTKKALHKAGESGTGSPATMTGNYSFRKGN